VTTEGGSRTGEARQAALGYELVGDLRRAKSALLYACIVWPIFAVLDAGYVLFGGEGDLATLLALRALPMPFFVLAYVRVRKRPPISYPEFQLLSYGAVYAVLFACALASAAT
jgi:hypothetical protein